MEIETKISNKAKKKEKQNKKLPKNCSIVKTITKANTEKGRQGSK